MRFVRRPYYWLFPALLALGACTQTGTGTSTAGGSVKANDTASSVAPGSSCSSSVDEYVTSGMVVDFDKAIRACPSLATLGDAIGGRDTTNTSISIQLSCTADVDPPVSGPTPDMATLTSPVCSGWRSECVDLKALADSTAASNRGQYSWQVPGLDDRVDASVAKMNACEAKYFS